MYNKYWYDEKNVEKVMMSWVVDELKRMVK